MPQDNGTIIMMYVNGLIADGVVEIEQSDAVGHRETLWRGSPVGVARLLTNLANLREDVRELRMRLQRAKQALDNE